MPRPITPNLPDDQFELTLLCPIGHCFAQHTYAFSKDVLKENRQYRKQVKENMVANITKAHTEGRHIRKGKV